MSRSVPLAAFLSVFAVAACRPEWEDVGTAHVGGFPDPETGASDPVSIEVDGQLDVWVEHHCAADRDPIADCTVRLRDETIEINSVLSLGRDPNGSCAESEITRCQSPALPEGAYRVIFGPSERGLDVPSTFDPFDLEGFSRD